MPKDPANTKPHKPEANPITQWLELNITASAAAGKLAPAFEIDYILDQVAEVLAAGRIPVITGESGVGKTAIVHELARRAQAGGPGVPASLRHRTIVQYSIQHIATSVRNPQLVGAEVHKLIEALGAQLADEKGFVPFFRDLHFAYQLHLTPSFQSLGLRAAGPVLAEADAAAYNRLLEDNPDFQQFFVQVLVEEPAPERVQSILSRWTEDQSLRGAANFEPRAIESAVALSHRFLTRDRQPRKVIDLLRQVGALVGPSRPATESDVLDRFCRHHHVPRVLVDPAMSLDMPTLEGRFRAELLGQPEAVEALLNLIAMVKAGLSDYRRPFGVFMFVGPTGVGKTHAAQLLAEYLFGGRDRVIRLNMADHGEDHSATVLFGDPDGYRLPQQRGVLTAKLGGRPFAVLLLDEFEKASDKVHDRFLQLFDEGAFINAAGETINCRSMIIIATSNAGAEIYRTESFGLAKRPAAEQRSRDAEVDAILQKQFRWEFLNRFDRIVHFHPLSRNDIRTIALREMTLLRSRFGLRQRQLELEIDESLLDWLAVHGYDPDNGARFLRRTIERDVVTAVADTIVREDPGPGRCMLLTVRAGRPVARLQGGGACAATETEPKLAVVLPAAVAGKRTAKLDAAELRDEAANLLNSAAPFLAALEQHKSERSRLLEEMNQADFWSARDRRGPTLDRFRELDVAVRTQERLASPLMRLRELVGDSPASVPVSARTDQLARQLELAADSLREWELRLAEEGAGAAWLVISSADPTDHAADWITDLANMEVAWCRRLHLTAEPVAFEPSDSAVGGPCRAVISVDGPGVASLLEMEVGLHRLRRPRQRDARARVDVIARGPSPTQLWPTIRKSSTRTPTLGLKPAWQGELVFPDRALTVTLAAPNRDTLSHVLSDLASAWANAPAAEPDTARLYGDDGGWVRDPRLDAGAVKIKEALKGRLDPLLEAWRQRSERKIGTSV